MFNFVNFLRKKFSEHSNSIVQKGTTIDALAVEPTGMVLADFYNAMVEQKRINDITNWENMTDAQLDAFGNKFFIPRVQGNIANGYIRIFFDNKIDINISSTLRAQSISGLLYQASIPSIISRNSFKISSDPSAKYYVDVLIVATAAGDNYNVDINGITGLIGAEFIYKKVTNPEKLSNGSPRESNQEYYQRLVYSINDRSLMNKRSVFAHLKNLFPYVSSMYIAGPGDKYMKRDLVQALDLSVPMKISEFTGKIPGNNSINNSAYYGIFPPEAGNKHASFNGPFSLYSNYKFPATIEPVNLASTEVGLHGYPLDQEATIEMYQGLYFDDYKNFMTVKTNDLFNILDEGLTLTPVTSPNQNWIIGANGKQNGDFGTVQAGLGNIDIINFKNNSITMNAGSNSAVTVSKDIQKRTGVKLTGTFTTPEAESSTSLNSGLQFMVAGVNNGYTVDSFSGIGFGVRINTLPNEDPAITNANVYFAHSEKYGSGQIFAGHDDFYGTDKYISVGSINALAEKTTRLTPGSEYEFEFIINDNLSLSLYIKKVSPNGSNDPDDIFTPWLLPSSILSAFKQEITNAETTHYGTMMKITLDTKSLINSDSWVINDLKAFDLAEHRSNALFIFDVEELESPLSIVFRGSGIGSAGGFETSGYSVYIWDTEQVSPIGGVNSLSIGGWTELEGVSNASGLKDSISTNLIHNLSNIDQYAVNSRYGTSIILLVSATGSSEAKIKSANQMNDDIYSEIQIDYIKVASELTDTYHSNNKSDLYVSTLKNIDNQELITTTLDKGIGESYFILNTQNGFLMPLSQIITVSSNVNGTTEILSEGSYKIIRNDINNINSNKENIYLSIENNNINSVTIEYTIYKNITGIQNLYDQSEYSKIYGNILVKHKFPCYLDINLSYTGSASQDILVNAIKMYTDQNADGIFSTQDLISYLYNQNLVNNVQIPLVISYSKYDDDMNIITGKFSDSLTIRDIDFFRINNISTTKL